MKDHRKIHSVQIGAALILLAIACNAPVALPATTQAPARTAAPLSTTAGPGGQESPAPATAGPLPSTPAEGGGPTQSAQPPQPALYRAAGTHIAQVWANDGGDKVTRDELRAANGEASVYNSAWNGAGVSLFGGRNETAAFNLVLEAPEAGAEQVGVSLPALGSPGGARIASRPASGDDLFNYVGRNIELFYVRYLEIRGLSVDLAYEAYDERHIPLRCRLPYDPATGEGQGGWEDRPCHNKLYPEIAVPLELHTPFDIPPASNQSIWVDIYIPKDAPPGEYTGEIEITEGGTVAWRVPVRLQVRDFTLPDRPGAHTMVYFSVENINERYLGESYPDPDTAMYQESLALADRHFQLAHRHRLSLIDAGDTEPEAMAEAWLDRLSGALFTPEQGYDGPGIGEGNGVYSIATYGIQSTEAWKDLDREGLWAKSDAWVEWFDQQAFAAPTEYFLYLIDESEDYPQTEGWARDMDENPGPGRRLMTMATLNLPAAIDETPSLDIPAGGYWIGDTGAWGSAAEAIRADPDRRLYLYNGHRPGSGSFATEDEGVALRMLPWAQYKLGAARWFYWESTSYTNYPCYGWSDDRARYNPFTTALTFGCRELDDESTGEANRSDWAYFNGDGVLFYPGRDRLYPETSYGVTGPFASLRMKHWRRGLQDYDYLALAAQVDPDQVAEIVKRLIPKVLWEVGIDEVPEDGWPQVYSDISWPVDPDAWEAARAELAAIIERAAPGP